MLSCLAAAGQKPLSAKKAYKPIRTALKAKKGADALATVNKLLADTAYNRDPRLYAYGVEAEMLICETFNEKLYLKQQIDTAQFFSAHYDLCQFVLRCDTAEQRLLQANSADTLNSKGARATVYRHQHRAILLRSYPNLSAAARFHYAKRQYKLARKYFNLRFNLPLHPAYGPDSTLVQQKGYFDDIYLDFRSMYELGEFGEMPQRADVLLSDSVLHNQVLDMLITAARGRSDTVAYYALVEQGLCEQPSRLDYFAILANRYSDNGDYEAAIALADTLLSRDPLNRYYLQCRALSLFKLGRLDESVIAAERLIAVDTTATEGYYILGYNSVDQAEKVVLPRQTRSPLYTSAKQRQTEFYTQARGYMERFRTLAPEEHERWAPLLYKIYLNLNLGKEFEEIQLLLNSQ